VGNRTVAKGGFFAVDRRIWERVCSLGMNEATVYARSLARQDEEAVTPTSAS